MKHRHLIVLVAVVMIVLSPTSHVRADMAPPELIHTYGFPLSRE